mgnify:CR=1 FL=1
MELKNSQFIRVDGLVKKYGDMNALKGISFSVEKGEITGFLGPNGAGKTTTMKIITGYIPPTEGAVYIDGKNMFADSLECRKKIGYLPEDVPLYDDMKVTSYLSYVCRLREIPKEEIPFKVDAMVEACDLEPVKNKLIRQLSKGNRQRVGIAQALVHDPEILILDEPTIGLDPKQVVNIRELISRLRENHTVILSTHILSEVEQMCDRVIIINLGSIVLDKRFDEFHDESAAYMLRIGGAEDDVRSFLSGVAGIDRTEKGDGGSVVYHIVLREDTDPALISQGIVEKGWRLYEMRRIRENLETVFLEAITK